MCKACAEFWIWSISICQQQFLKSYLFLHPNWMNRGDHLQTGRSVGKRRDLVVATALCCCCLTLISRTFILILVRIAQLKIISQKIAKNTSTLIHQSCFKKKTVLKKCGKMISFLKSDHLASKRTLIYFGKRLSDLFIFIRILELVSLKNKKKISFLKIVT